MKTDKFAPNSRFADAEIATLTLSDGGSAAYVRRRFIPSPEHYALLREHLVRDGDRLDRIAAIYLGDAEQFWRIADANGAIDPDELTSTPGRLLRITLPAGVPGTDESSLP
jgi:hypothetical protein